MRTPESVAGRDVCGSASTMGSRGNCEVSTGMSETSCISSSSESDDAYRKAWMGGKIMGTVGIQTGSVGLEDRFRLRFGKVGDVGDACGVLRRTKDEMGMFAVRSVSDRVSFCGRREELRGAMDADLRLMAQVAGNR